MGIRFTIKQNPLQIEFDADSIQAGVKELLDNESHISRAFGIFRAEIDEEDERTSSDEASPKGARKPRKRKGEGEATAETTQPAPPPVTASAPPPAPVPGQPVTAAPPPPPANVAAKGDDLGIPPFLDRTKDAATAAAPPPPPPVAVAPPPATERLADKVVKDIQARKASSADGGAGFMSWLISNFPDMITKDATIDEAIAVIQFQDDAKVGRLAKALGIG